ARKARGQTLLALNPLELRRHLLPAPPPEHRERHRCAPPPPYREHRRVQQRLGQYFADGFGPQIPGNIVQRKAVHRAERDYYRVLGCSRLELEIEFAAESLSERQPPGP